MGVISNVVKLMAIEAFAVFLLYVVVRYAFGIDIFDFDSTRGRMVAIGIVVVFIGTFASVLFEPDALRTIGAQARYDPSDKRRVTAAYSYKPSPFFG